MEKKDLIILGVFGALLLEIIRNQKTIDRHIEEVSRGRWVAWDDTVERDTILNRMNKRLCKVFHKDEA